MDDQPTVAPAPAKAIAEFAAAYASTWARESPLLLRRLRAADLTDAQIAAVLTIIHETCNHCWDGPAGCHCTNEE